VSPRKPKVYTKIEDEFIIVYAAFVLERLSPKFFRVGTCVEGAFSAETKRVTPERA
jgi:hypothetical protein